MSWKTSVIFKTNFRDRIIISSIYKNWLRLPHTEQVQQSAIRECYTTVNDASFLSPFRPFHNWRTSPLQHFAIEFFWLRTRYCIRCTNSHIRCMRFCVRIKSPQSCGHAHHLDTTERDPNYCNAKHEHWYGCFSSLCLLGGAMHDFERT